MVQRREDHLGGGFCKTQDLLQVLLGRVYGWELASSKEMTEQNDQVLLCLDPALVRTYLVDDTRSKKRDQCEIAWFRIVQMRCDTEQIQRSPLTVDQARAPEVLDRESKMMQKLMFPFLRIPNDVRHLQE